MLSQIVIYSIVATTLGVINLIIGILSFTKKDEKGIYLGIAVLYSVFVNVAYMHAISTSNYLEMKIAYSIYSTSIDMMLIFLYYFVQKYTNKKTGKVLKISNFVIWVFLTFEVVIFTINIFNSVAVEFIYLEDLKVYKFKMHALYYFHLLYTYVLSFMSLSLLSFKVINVPSIYRRFYAYAQVGIIAVILINVIYLFFRQNVFDNFLYKYDVSIWFYTIVIILLYWNCYDYSKNGYINHLKKYIFEAIGQLIVVFDDDDLLLYSNDKAEEAFNDFDFNKNQSISAFLNYCKVNKKAEDKFKKQTFTLFKGESDVYRCKYLPVFDKHERFIASIFAFEKSLLEIDPLTGLNKIESISRVLREKLEQDSFPIAIGVCDLNGLHDININYGSQIGDKSILKMVDVMRNVLPKDAYLFRGDEANIVAVLLNTEKATIQKYFKEIQSYMTKIDDLGCFLSIQFSTTQTTEKGNLNRTIQSTIKSMKNKKLLDGNSLHSETMTSLLKTLEECDSDTESHVKRTQALGSMLGRLLKLTDDQLSDLDLLCVLHDIGKIAVPLDILNKPGKLTDEEWKVIKSHVIKGYQIVNSSLNISHIARMVLHHHEMWDGNGYPDGLKGKEIPLLSRIISVVDAYDAMVSDRPYRKGTTHEKAIMELIRCSGTQFDPEITKVFVEMIKEREHITIDENAISVNSKKISAFTGKENVDNISVVKYAKYTVDEENYIIAIDDNFEKITGYNQKDIDTLHLNQNDLLFKEDIAGYAMTVANQLNKNQEAYIEHRIKTKDGFTRYLLCFGKRRYDSAKRREVSDITITNISDSRLFQINVKETINKGKEVIDSWHAKYHLDSLTGLLTFDAFKDEVDTKLVNFNHKYVLTVIDIDNFRNYDETYGYNKGDEVLCEIGNALASLLYNHELACRISGDKFLALLVFDSNEKKEQIKSRIDLISDKLNMTLSSIEGGTSISLVGKYISHEDDFTTIYGETYTAFRKLKARSKEKRLKELL